MDNITVTDRISVHSDGKRWLVEHDLGDRFILNIEEEVDIETLTRSIFPEIQIFGVCFKGREGFTEFKQAINEIEQFIEYVYSNQNEFKNRGK